MGDYLTCGAGVAALETVASAVNRSEGITQQDRIRERELLRYYRPKRMGDDSANQTPIPSPPASLIPPDSTSPISDGDVILAALAQLAALRLDAHRSMINVIGRETQYTLVESSKTLDLSNQTTAERAGDESWVGAGGTLHKKHTICESVVLLPPGQEPFLIVPDLRQHPEFKTRSYVQGPPYYRFYAGRSLRTTQGVVIGALCAFAHETRAGLSQTEKDFLSNIADTIMGHLEMKRAAAERDKVTMMSRGLNAFVESSTSQFAAMFDREGHRDSVLNSPLSPHEDRHLQASDSKRFNGNPSLAEHLDHSRIGSINAGIDSTSMPGTVPEEQPPSSQSVSKNSSTPTELSRLALEHQIQATLARAAALLSECLGLRNRGGVVFYDTVTRIDNLSDNGSTAASPFDHPDEWGASSDADGGITPGIFDGVIDSEDAMAPVLAAKVSSIEESPKSSDSLFAGLKADGTVPSLKIGSIDASTSEQLQAGSGTSYRKLASRMLRKLMKRHPSGKTWEFDEHGLIPHGEYPVRQAESAEREARQRTEGVVLSRLFPGVRSLILVPLWDANLSRHYAGCFVWTTDAMSRFSLDVEFSFVTAFSNSISAEISRLATLEADQKKSDFIGSISHELRSPLHGVLASGQLLSDTPLSSFQSALATTIDNCARTLLDTINHVLDYSKINTLRRTWKETPKADASSSLESKQAKVDFRVSGIMSITGSTDFAAITEEVIDSIYAGKTYAKGLSPEDISDPDGELARCESELHPQRKAQYQSDVQVFLDIEPGDYHFVSQPGALRRIVMNLFGNALKYTDKGSIVVKLHQTGIEGSQHAQHHHKVVLTVKDTGKGISSSYLKTQLYTPFAQEDDLAPGTGLGLSIVKTLVTMLRGEISIMSQKGKGTEVRVFLPHMSRPGANLGPGEVEPERTTLENFRHLKAVSGEIRIGLRGFDEDGHKAHGTEDVLRKYLQDYCSAKCVTHWQAKTQPSALIIDEHSLWQLEKDSFVNDDVPTIVLCESPIPLENARGLQSRFHFLLKPFGPYRLAKALRKCLDMNQKQALANQSLATKSINESKVSPHPTESAKRALDTQDETLARLSRPRLATISTDPRVPTRAAFAKHTNSGLVPASGPGFKAAYAAKTPSHSTINTNGKTAVQPLSRSPRILVVDDNPTNRNLLRAYLSKKCGIEADQATDGSLAVKAAVQTHYDIIFMDISMPIMNGFTATREIRKHEEMKRRASRRNSRNQYGAIPATSSGPSDHIPPPSSRIELPPQDMRDSMLIQEDEPHSGFGPRILETPPGRPEDVEHEVADTRAQGQSGLASVKPSLIIALTGLGSERDQEEAFMSGIDLFMTKPFHFQEVRKLIDNWAASGGLQSSTD